jgi:hypothetical protein
MSGGRQRRKRAQRRAAPEPSPTFDDMDDEAAYWEAEGRRCAIEGMDLPDGAYFAMMDEAGLEP